MDTLLTLYSVCQEYLYISESLSTIYCVTDHLSYFLRMASPCKELSVDCRSIVARSGSISWRRVGKSSCSDSSNFGAFCHRSRGKVHRVRQRLGRSRGDRSDSAKSRSTKLNYRTIKSILFPSPLRIKN